MLSMDGWDGVDAGLEEIGLIDLEIASVASIMGRKLHEVLSGYAAKIKDLNAKRRAAESAIESFCLLNKSDFAKKRSRRLQYGKIAFRTAERIDVPDDLQDAAIATLKKLGFSECIEIRERLDRAALKKLADADLARCGIKRLREDHFRIEPDLGIISEKIGSEAPGMRQVSGEAIEKFMDYLKSSAEGETCAGPLSEAV